MANVVHQKTIILGRRLYINYITLVSDGSQETNTVIYDSSAVSAAAGIPDSMNARIEKVWFSSANNDITGDISLTWDASTDVLALPMSMGVSSSVYAADFSEFGGLPNYAGAGVTGDLLMTTLGIGTSDSFMLVLQMRLC